MTPEFARRADWEEVLALWQEVFGDEREYIETFLAHFFEDGYSMPVLREDGKIVCMLNLLEFELREHNIPQTRCSYIFAAATHPRHRGRGLMHRLIEFSLEVCRGRGHSMVFLIPANESLYGFYAGMGFRESFWRYEFGVPEGADGYMLEEFDICDDGEWEQFRRAYTEYTACQPLAIIKDEKFFDYSMREYFLDEGMSDIVVDEGGAWMGYLLYRETETEVRVDGFIPSNPAVDYKKFSGLFPAGSPVRCGYALAAAMGADGTAVRAGMAYPLNERIGRLLEYAGKTLYISGFGETKTDGGAK